MIGEPSQYSWRWDRSRSLKVYRQWADQAWIAESGACPEVGAVDEYALGFRDGFVDFVYAGGDGQPPPVPPRKFWNVAWRTPEGDVAAQQWFAGYRHGAQSARNGGYRQGGIVNSSYRTGGGPGPWITGTPTEMENTDFGSPLGAPIEPLPAPTDAPAVTSPDAPPVTPDVPAVAPSSPAEGPTSEGEPLPARPLPPTDDLAPESDNPFSDMLPAEEPPAGEGAEGAMPLGGAQPTDAAQGGSFPRAFELPVNLVNPASLVVPAAGVMPAADAVPANPGAQRFRRAVSTIRTSAPGATQ